MKSSLIGQKVPEIKCALMEADQGIKIKNLLKNKKTLKESLNRYNTGFKSMGMKQQLADSDKLENFRRSKTKFEPREKK